MERLKRLWRRPLSVRKKYASTHDGMERREKVDNHDLISPSDVVLFLGVGDMDAYGISDSVEADENRTRPRLLQRKVSNSNEELVGNRLSRIPGEQMRYEEEMSDDHHVFTNRFTMERTPGPLGHPRGL